VKHAAVIRNVAALIAIAAIVSSCSQKSPDQDYLIRVNDRVITVDQFKRSVDAASEEAFPGEQNVSFENIQDLRVRVLNQLSEELMIAAHASAIGLSVDDAELTSRVDAIKADYPDDTFQETLLENAVSFESWKQKLAMRMLVEKVVEKELVDQVDITSADVATISRTTIPMVLR
jgi:FKBP-type peptidyl-prolyl cis-trans isomerase (trigger factor)